MRHYSEGLVNRVAAAEEKDAAQQREIDELKARPAGSGEPAMDPSLLLRLEEVEKCLNVNGGSAPKLIAIATEGGVSEVVKATTVRRRRLNTSA